MFIIYGRDYCLYCRKAKELLTTQNIEFIYHNLDLMDVDEKIITNLKNKYKVSTIPLIFIDDKFIGGFEELYKTL